MSLKQLDGSFLVSHNAEVDSRAIYCLLTTATLLNILTPDLVSGTAAFIAACQTYEGGFASSALTSITQDGEPSSSGGIPLGEAHGGYTFCCLASWVMLQPFVADIPEETRPKVDLRSLRRWLVMMQGMEIELGGFRGRTNKLVDGCYSWWVAGCFGLLDALEGNKRADELAPEEKHEDGKDTEWTDVDGMIPYFKGDDRSSITLS
jgi:protein farnesyltransferase subunit beta